MPALLNQLVMAVSTAVAVGGFRTPMPTACNLTGHWKWDSDPREFDIVIAMTGASTFEVVSLPSMKKCLSVCSHLVYFLWLHHL
jgi:hypothetical protein